MSSPTLTAATVMDASASLLNDTAKSVYTYVVQIPYLQMALKELREWFEQNGISVTQATSAVIQMDEGDTIIVFDAAPGDPELPDDLIEPLQLWERPRDIDPWIPMTRKDFIPHYLEGEEISQFIFYQWDEQKITVLPANQDNDIKIDYIKELFQTVDDSTDSIGVINAASFLQYRTAALCAEFIERNLTSAQGLNGYAMLARDRVTSISSKSKQTIQTRRRPFRSNWKNRRVII